MNLNIAILKYELSPLEFSGGYDSQSLALDCTYPLPYRKGMTLKPGVVYLAYAEDLPIRLPHTSEPLNIICIGDYSPEKPRSNVNLIKTLDQIGLEVLLERVLKIFHDYYEWEQKMQLLICENADLKTFASISQAIVRNPVLFSFSGMRCAFHNADSLRAESRRKFRAYCQTYTETGELLKENELPPLETISSLVSNPDYPKIALTDTPSTFENPTLDYDSLYINLFMNGKPYGRLVFDGVQHSFTDRDRCIITIMAQFLDRMIKTRLQTKAYDSELLDGVIVKMLEHKLVDESAINNALEQHGWKAHGAFFVLVLEPNSYAQKDTVIVSLAAQLSQQLPNAHAIAFRENIVVVAELSNSTIDKEAYLHRAITTFRDNLLLSGTSLMFSDFKNIYYYYQQAHRALHLGKKEHPTNWHFDYSDYLLEDLLDHARGSQPIEACVPDGFKKLLDYDTVHNTELIPLLETYLNNSCNVADTSRALFIHRNTCLYRLERIREISGDDFADPNTRLLYLIVLALVANSKRSE